MTVNKKPLIIAGAVVIIIALIFVIYSSWRVRHPNPVTPFIPDQSEESLNETGRAFQREAAIEPPTAETRVVAMPVVTALTQIIGGAKIIGASAAAGADKQAFNLVVPKNMGEIDTNDLIYALNNAGLVLKGRTDNTSTGAINIQGAAMSGKETLDWEMTFTTSSNSVIVRVGR